MLRRFKISPSPDQAAGPPEVGVIAVPVLWLLGKTGAGKSSLIHTLTGLSEVEIGNGFASCTRTSLKFDYPPDAPLLRFLDTRGLGEAGYDPTEDLGACEGASHAILVVARLDDPVQGEVAEALRNVLSRQPDMPVLLVHTGGDRIASQTEAERARAATAQRFEAAVKRPLPETVLAMPPDGEVDPAAYDALIERLLDLLPEAGLLLSRQEASTREQAAFERVKRRVLLYAGAAGTTDVAPIIGAVTVPAIQIGLLRELGNHYGVDWNRRTTAEFAGALGLGTVARFGGSYGLRQLAKLVPVYGQTVGAALAGSVSFAATYALGRGAAYYLHARAAGKPVSPEELRAAYAKSFERAKRAAP